MIFFKMHLNSKQATFTIPVYRKDQAEAIRNIEVAANKALQNIHCLYDEIFKPKANPDEDCDANVNDYTSDSTSVSINDINVHHSCGNVSKFLQDDLCSKCQKLVSLHSASHKQDSSIILPNQHPRILSEKLMHGHTSSYTVIKPFRRNSSYHPEQKNLHQYAQGNTSRGRRETYQQEEFQRQRNFSMSNSYEKEQIMEKQLERTSSFPESISECHDFSSSRFKNVRCSNMQFKVTVPKPFSLTAENIKRQRAKEEKILRLREELDSQIEKELNVKFSPKPVPKHVHLPLYGEMRKLNEKRRKERKDKCIEIIAEKTKHFNSNITTQTCVTKLMHDESKTFIAKPVPKHILSENLSERIKNKEEIRKLLISQRAEEMLKKSSLPFSTKPIHFSLSLYNVSNSPNKNVNVTKERVEAITNRLYRIKCQETIENWNKKILQHDFENTNSHKKSSEDKNSHKIAPHFQNFPVRTTTATFLRERQIRANIEMRKLKEETNENLREEISRKRKEILKNIWPRLKSAEKMDDIEKDIEEKVKSHRKSQKNREQEYEKELEDMMRRVSKQFLLIERQSKELKGQTNISAEEQYSSGKDEESDCLENEVSSSPSAPENSDST